MYSTYSTEFIVKNLNAFHEQHEDDVVGTGDTNCALLCKAAADKLNELYSELKLLKSKYQVVDAIFRTNKDNCTASTYCKVDMRTKEVFDIGENRVSENGGVFINGNEYHVSKKGSGTEYWFEKFEVDRVLE